MKLLAIIKESTQAITVNKMRTGLAVLGIVIGIGSVIALISLGQSSQKAISNQIQQLGSNLLTISPGSVSQGGVRGGAGGVTTLVEEDAKAISTTLPNLISLVSPEITKRSQVTTTKTNTNTQVIGAQSAYATVHKVSMDSGNFITDRDVETQARVAVVGPTVASDLFGTSNPIGLQIRINGQVLTIIGVTKSKGGTGFNNQDDIVYIPLSTAVNQVFGQKYLNAISLTAKNESLMVEASNQVGFLLLTRHKLKDPTQADFSIFSQQDILNTVSSTAGTFTALLSGVAAISLLVGGIGIMNIMLVTVTERTREIGLRKALGARKKTILIQFLLEASMLTLTGGVLGVILGIGLSWGYSTFTQSPFVIVPTSILLAFAVSTVIGVVFGMYPANKASNLQPIEALRFE